MELFMHVRGQESPELVEIESTNAVRDLLSADEVEARVWLEEVDDEVDLNLTVEEAGIGPRHHVHRGRCPRVEVTVRYGGEQRERSFGPGTTVRTIHRWATGTEAFGLTPEQAAKHVLALPDADHFLEGGVHVGSLVASGSCAVVLNLLPRERFEG